MSFPIAISLSPNLTFKDAIIAASFIFLPWKWLSLRKGQKRRILTDKLKKYFKVKNLYLMGSGREALYFYLDNLGLRKGDEVLVQAFNCIVVPNAVHWAGLKSVYVDIEENTLNIDPLDLKKKISERSKVLVIQHTFGRPANLDKLLKIAKDHNLIVIEDCAHALGVKYQGRMVGTFGQAAIFSLGRDKVLSSVHGGFLITKANLDQVFTKLPEVKRCRVLQHLSHALINYFLVLPFYNFASIGKIFLVISQKLKLISKVLVSGEKQGKIPVNFPTKLPNSLAMIGLHQFSLLTQFNKRRQQIAQQYQRALPKLSLPDSNYYWMRYPILTDKALDLINYAKKNQIILGDWYNPVVAPSGVKNITSRYQAGSCPVAEKVAPQIVNLPTYARLSDQQVQKIIVTLIRKYAILV